MVTADVLSHWTVEEGRQLPVTVVQTTIKQPALLLELNVTTKRFINFQVYVLQLM